MMMPCIEVDVTFEMAMAAACELNLGEAELELAMSCGHDEEASQAGDQARDRLMATLIDHVSASYASSCATMDICLFDQVVAQLLAARCGRVASPNQLPCPASVKRAVLH
jgi:hypothetical protein